MNIVIYKNKTPLNHISRNITQVASLTGTLKEGCSIISPDITVDYKAAYIKANYAYIADFGRYYFFREPPDIGGDTMILHLYADALYNYRNEVLSADCIAERSSSNYDLYVDDSAVTSVAGYDFTNFSLPYEFQPDRGTYVLMVAGGQ